jgi:dTDP-4-amino-4,6-dideoxygalactose transaminase
LGAWEYDIVGPWFKCNSTDVAAAMGLVQMKRYGAMLERRKQIIGMFDAALKPIGVEVLDHYNETNQSSGHLYITAQNHGWSVADANETAEVTFLHAGDGSIEGLEYKNIPAFSVQFTPDTDEIAAGTGFLYQKFLQKMTK